MSYRPVSKNSATSSLTFQPPTGYHWLVQQIAVTSTAQTLTKARVYVMGRFSCGTSSGNEDSADGNPLPVPTGGTLTVTWTGGTSSAHYAATLYVTESAN